MAWYKCGGGGALTETTLWSNNAPTTATGSKTVTLSESIANYKYVKIKWRLTTTSSVNNEILIPINQFKKSLSDAQSCIISISGRWELSGSYVTYMRRVYYVSNTSVTFSSGAQVGGTATNTAYIIPLSISGVK